MLLEVVREKVDDVEVEGEFDLAHNLRLLVDISSPEESYQIHRQVSIVSQQISELSEKE